MLENQTISLKELGVIVAVHRALVHDHFAVHIFVIHHVAMPVKFIGRALGTESDKDGQSAEIVDVVVDGW